MPFWTYILRCADGAYYTGHTDDLDRRVGEHRADGFCVFTSRRRPVTLAWSETFGEEALSAELVVEKWSRARKEALMDGDWSGLPHFAKPPRERIANGELAL